MPLFVGERDDGHAARVSSGTRSVAGLLLLSPARSSLSALLLPMLLLTLLPLLLRPNASKLDTPAATPGRCLSDLPQSFWWRRWSSEKLVPAARRETQRAAVECRHCCCFCRLPDRSPNDRTADAAETNATLPAVDGERGRKPDALAHTLVSAAGKRADAHGRMREEVKVGVSVCPAVMANDTPKSTEIRSCSRDVRTCCHHRSACCLRTGDAGSLGHNPPNLQWQTSRRRPTMETKSSGWCCAPKRRRCTSFATRKV